MWNWLFGPRPRRTTQGFQSATSFAGPTGALGSSGRPSQDHELGGVVGQGIDAVSVGPEFDEVGNEFGALRSKLATLGYRGPYEVVCDRMRAAVFVGPRSGVAPKRLRADDHVNPFRIEVWDARNQCADCVLAPLGEHARLVRARFERSWRKGRMPFEFPTPALTGLVEETLAYPRPDPELWPATGRRGPLALAQTSSDLWNLHLRDDTLYLTRSWSGHLRYKVQTRLEPRGLFVTRIESYRGDDHGGDAFTLRQVDYLIKTLIFGITAPAPLPPCRTEAEEDPFALAWRSLVEYGRLGGFPSLADTTEYRLGLNRSARHSPPPANRAALMAATRLLSQSERPTVRHAGYEELRRRTVFAAVASESWSFQGRPALAIYTDPILALEPEETLMEVPVPNLWELVKEHRSIAALNRSRHQPPTHRAGEGVEEGEAAEEAEAEWIVLIDPTSPYPSWLTAAEVELLSW